MYSTRDYIAKLPGKKSFLNFPGLKCAFKTIGDHTDSTTASNTNISTTTNSTYDNVKALNCAATGSSLVSVTVLGTTETGERITLDSSLVEVNYLSPCPLIKS